MTDQVGSSDVHEVMEATAPRSGGDPGREQVEKALRGLRFGEVRIVVHDGAIVQIERLEKYRLR